MRISDWSSDVCSSDLGFFRLATTPTQGHTRRNASFEGLTSLLGGYGSSRSKLAGQVLPLGLRPVHHPVLCHCLLGRGSGAQSNMGGRVACRSRLHPVSSPSYYRLRSRRNVGSQVQPHGASNKVLGNVGAVLGSRWVVLVRRAQHVCRSR